MEPKSREPMLCYKCKLHGQRTLYRGGHSRLCQYRNCSCQYCTKHDVSRNINNNLRAHIQDIKERPRGHKTEDVKIEVEVKLEVNTEPMEYDEESNFERGTDENSLTLDFSEDDLNTTAGIVLNQSEDNYFSDSDLNLSQQSSHYKSSPHKVYSAIKSKPRNVCPYCDNIFVEPLKFHFINCVTAKKFEENEESAGGNNKHLESDVSDTEMPNELDLSSTPSTSATSDRQLTDKIVNLSRRSNSPPLQCPICSSDFSQSSLQELEAHAGTCQDFSSLPDVRICFMCDQEFSSSVPEIEFLHHVEDHFKEKDLQEQFRNSNLVRTENEMKRKVDSEALLKTTPGPSKLPKQDQTHSSGRSHVNQFNESSKIQVKEKSPEITQFPGTSQTKAKSHSFQNKMFPGSSLTQVKEESTQIKQSIVGPSPTLVKDNVSKIRPEVSKSSPAGFSQADPKKPLPPKSAPHIQSLISRFDENCSQPAVHHISVAADMVGLIIGEKAWFKKKVLEDTVVNISAEYRNSQASGPVTVTLRGPSVNLPKAVAMIELKLGLRMGFMQKF